MASPINVPQILKYECAFVISFSYPGHILPISRARRNAFQANLYFAGAIHLCALFDSLLRLLRSFYST